MSGVEGVFRQGTYGERFNMVETRTKFLRVKHNQKCKKSDVYIEDCKEACKKCPLWGNGCTGIDEREAVVIVGEQKTKEEWQQMMMGTWCKPKII